MISPSGFGYRSWVEEPMVLNGAAAYSVVSHQGKGKANVGGVPAVNFQKGYDIFFREGGAPTQ